MSIRQWRARIEAWTLERLLDLATICLLPWELLLVDSLWLAFVGIVAYGNAHTWARKWIMAVYAWMVGKVS